MDIGSILVNSEKLKRQYLQGNFLDVLDIYCTS